MPRAQLEAIVQKVGKALGGKAKVNILDSVTDFDPTIKPGTRSGVVADGEVYLFADGIEGGVNAEKTVFHELFHKGLRNLFTPAEFAEVMESLYAANPGLKAESEAWLNTDAGKDVLQELADQNLTGDIHARAAEVFAFEEILAGVSEGRATPTTMRAIGNWFANVADRLGLNQLAKWLRQANRSDLEKFIQTALESGASEAQIKPIPKAVEAEAGAAPAEAAPTIRAFRSAEEKADTEFGNRNREREDRSVIDRLVAGVNKESKGAGLWQYVRVQTVDIASSVDAKMHGMYSKGVQDYFGNFNPMMLFRQALDVQKLVKPFYDLGALKQNPDGTFEAVKAEGPSVKDITRFIQDVAAKRGVDFDTAKNSMNTLLEANRLWHLREMKKAGADITLHKLDDRAGSPDLNTQIDTGKALFDESVDSKEYLRMLDAVRFRLLDTMVESGRISKEQAAEWKEASGYVAFDRLGDAPLRKRGGAGKGIAKFSKIPEFTGSQKFLVGDLFDNMLGTYSWMISESVKNQAAVKTLDAMRLGGYATRKPSWESIPDKSRAVRAFENGEEVFYEVRDKLDALAFNTATMGGQVSKFTTLLQQGSNLMRMTVTATPMFTLKQVVDDATRIMLYPGLKNPIAAAASMLYNAPKFAIVSLMPKNSPGRKFFEFTFAPFGAREALDKAAATKAHLESIGVTGEFDFRVSSAAKSYLTDLGLKPRGKWGTFIHTMEELSRASDIAARAEVYTRTKKETGDETLAATRARELINFRRQGASKTIQWLSTTVPFFNASIQGTDVLLRSALGLKQTGVHGGEVAAARTQFLQRAGLLAGASLLYTILMADDDEYRNASELVRAANIIGPNGLKFPLPRELSIIFKMIPEQAYLHLYEDANEEGKTAIDGTMRTLRDVVFALTPGIPFPVVLRPIAEAYTNFSLLTGRTLQGTYQLGREAEYRSNESTSELAKLIGGYIKASPIIIDNFLNAWFGMTASLVTLVADGMLNPEKADRPLYKLPFASMVTYDAKAQADISTAFYEIAGKARQARDTASQLARTNPDKYGAYVREKAAYIALAPSIEQTLQKMETLRAQRKFIQMPGNGMTSAEKELALKENKEVTVANLAHAKSLQYWVTRQVAIP